MRREDKAKLLAVTVLAGLAAAVLCNGVIYGHALKLGYPFSSFLFNPDQLFADYFNDVAINYARNPYQALNHALNSVYLPFGNFVQWLFGLISLKLGALVFMAGGAAFLARAAYTPLKQASPAGTLAAIVFGVVLSYPSLYLFSRGNFELLVFAFLFMAVRAYRNGRHTAAAVWLALSMAYKPFSAVFLVLFIADTKYKQAALSLVICAGTTLASSLFLQSGINGSLRLLQTNMTLYNQEYVLKFYGMVFGHSGFGGVKFVWYALTGQFPATPPQWLVAGYFCAALIMAGALFAFSIKENPLWKKTALLTCAMTLLPFVSADYRLLHFFIPLFLFMEAKESPRFDRAYVLLFGLLLIPKHYWYFWGTEISVSVFVSPLLIAALAGLIIYERVSTKSLSDGE